MSNLSEFLQENGITKEVVFQESKALERWNTKDRAIMTRRSDARRLKKSYEEMEVPKARGYGRGISLRTLDLALKGDAVRRMSRKKITRAVNALLTGQSKEPVEWRVLFGDVGSRKGKSK